MTDYTTIDSPIGELLLTAEHGALTGLHFSPFAIDREWRHDPEALHAAATQLAEYFAGERTRFDLELSPEGTEFQRKVWAMLQIPKSRHSTRSPSPTG